jgi:hypothetical protein
MLQAATIEEVWTTRFVAMKKVFLPAPPQPFHTQGAAPIQSGSSQNNIGSARSLPSASKTVAPLDAAFLSRVARTTTWFGTFLSLCILCTTRSPEIAISFGAGAILSLMLLKSQQMLVSRLARSKEVAAEKNWIARLPLVFLLPAKYVVVAVGIYFGLKFQLLVPPAFATGFTVLQVVVVSKVVSRLLLQNQKPLREVYVSNEK